MNVPFSSRATEPANLVQSNGLVEIDPRLACLQQASARCTLVELGEIPLDTAFSELVGPFSEVIGFPACQVCGSLPCTNESFCEACRLADQRLAQKRRRR